MRTSYSRSPAAIAFATDADRLPTDASNMVPSPFACESVVSYDARLIFGVVFRPLRNVEDMTEGQERKRYESKLYLLHGAGLDTSGVVHESPGCQVSATRNDASGSRLGGQPVLMHPLNLSVPAILRPEDLARRAPAEKKMNI